jgi:hypothetical protein
VIRALHMPRQVFRGQRIHGPKPVNTAPATVPAMAIDGWSTAGKLPLSVRFPRRAPSRSAQSRGRPICWSRSSRATGTVGEAQ